MLLLIVHFLIRLTRKACIRPLDWTTVSSPLSARAGERRMLFAVSCTRDTSMRLPRRVGSLVTTSRTMLAIVRVRREAPDAAR